MRWDFWRRRSDRVTATAREAEPVPGAGRPAGGHEPASLWSRAVAGSAPEPVGAATPALLGAPDTSDPAGAARAGDPHVGRMPPQVAPLLRALHAEHPLDADRLCAELALAGSGPVGAAHLGLHAVLAMHLDELGDEAEDGGAGAGGAGAGDAGAGGPGAGGDGGLAVHGGRGRALQAGRALALQAGPLLARLLPAATPDDVDLSLRVAAAEIDDEVKRRLQDADLVLLARLAAVLLLAELGPAPLEPLLEEVAGVFGAL